MTCPTCNSANPSQASFCQKCGSRLPSSGDPTAAAAVGATTVSATYAGFWTRFVAMVIDFLVVAVATGIATTATMGAGVVLTFVGPWLYEAFMLSSEWQATLGKRAMNIIVTGADGGRITFARATGRHFAKWISGLLLGIGFIIAAFTARKQALHDMIADTFVINR